VSLEQEKLAEYEMQQRLESIPRSKYYPMDRLEVVNNIIETLTKRIHKLQAFVEFLSMKTLKEWYQWMTAACARYVPGNVSLSNRHEVLEEEQDFETALSEKSLSLKPGKTAKRTKGKLLRPAR